LCVQLPAILIDMKFGLATFADLASGVSPEQRMRNLFEEAELADQVGLDVFAVGEHHRPDYLVSAPAAVLAAIAVKTERIRLSSAVTVLSSDDPVRVFQQFAHVDLLSGGRAEIMAGRGSFIESFPLFGYDLDDYDELFAEKLDLLLAIRDHARHRTVRDQGRTARQQRARASHRRSRDAFTSGVAGVSHAGPVGCRRVT
jgi:alkanesulfonate monooxygenase SsuD/methylene tetrahydromethanopterin reductase-like flavin-dependent oxidoreductase (luciferase family)